MKTSFVNNLEVKRKIGGLEYSILSAEEAINMGEVRLQTQLIYRDGVVVEQGPIDQRMGISHKGDECKTCQVRPKTDCPGHFGFYELSVPIFHLGFFRHIVMSLNCLCKNCGSVRMRDEDKEYYRKRMRNCMVKKNYRKRMDIFKEIVAKCKKQQICNKCGFYMEGVIKKLEKVAGRIIYSLNTKEPFKLSENDKNKKFSKEEMLSLYIDNRNRMDIHPLLAYYLFSQVQQDDQILFAINPMKNSLIDLLTYVVPAPPNIIRPSVVLSNAMSNEDDLTVKLKNIISFNMQVDRHIEMGDDMYKFTKDAYLMQCHYFHYFNSDVRGLPTQEMDGKMAIRGLYQRLKGKRGRFRGNLSGKRADFTARTVISPDPNLPIDCVTIPEFMARILTIPEKVNDLNIVAMRRLVVNGPQSYPGANYLIISEDGSKRDLGFGNKRLLAKSLKIGDTVERHIQDGDIVLFNRQPSLHRISIMAFRARVDKWNTLRFNECACTPFNADFDGDEMNIHAPQTVEARAEALLVMGITRNLLTIKSGECLVSLTQDFLTTAWLITNKDVFFTRSQFSQICCGFSDANEQIDLPTPSILKPYELWTGKQVINTLLRPNRLSQVVVNLEMKESNCSKEGKDCMDTQDGYVIIDKSELVCGNLGKKVLGSSKNGLFYSLNRDNSAEVAAEVMLRVSKLSSRWISHQGMTIGIGDVTPTPDLIAANLLQIQASYESCEDDIRSCDQGLLEAKPGMTIEQTLESMVKMKLSNVRDTIGSYCQSHLTTDNKVLTMFLCGAKGSNINMSQMIGCVGQQIVSGKRVPDGFTDRSLPHFVRNDRHPRAKGFVKNSFYSGMNAIEFFFHTMGGREGLIDTAVKTADTGYMQRRLIKMLEDLHVAYDLTVRSCDTKEIVQFMYGEDGMDPGAVEDLQQPIRLNIILQNIKTIIQSNRNPTIENQKPLLPYEILDNLNRLLSKVEEQYRGFLSTVMQTYNRQKALLIQFFELKARQIGSFRTSRGLLEAYSYDEANKIISGEVIDDSIQMIALNNFDSISRIQLMLFVKTWMQRFLKLLCPPGTSVGPIASQSIGEPATQMTLKTFHFAGVASMNVTLGVPRIKEIINAAKTIKTPIIRIRLQPEHMYDDVVARKILIQVEKTKIGQILKSIDEIYSVGSCYLKLQLDNKAIHHLQLDIGANDIKNALINHKKLGLRSEQIDLNTRTGVLKIEFGVQLAKLKSGKKNRSKNILFEMQEVKKQIMDVQIKGLDQIKQVVITKAEKDNKEDGELKDERIIYAEGYGLQNILRIEGVDAFRTKTNHIMEIYKVLGIEAARQRIMEEIVYTMKSHGISLDVRHVLLAAETMTFKGKVLGFTRFGVDKLKNSTLMLASFEKTMEILFDAAIQGKEDSLNGVSQRIIIGQNVPIGTGMFDVMWGRDSKVLDSQISEKDLLFG